MIVGQGADLVRHVHDLATALHGDVLHLLNGVKATVDERFVDKLPDALGRLELWAVWGLKDLVDASRPLDLLACVPASIVHHQDNLLLTVLDVVFGEVFQCQAEDLGVYSWEEQPVAASCGRVDEGV